MTNPLTDIIPAAARKYVYAAYALAIIVVGALSVGGVDVGKVPDVLAYIGGALALTAASNVTPLAASPDARPFEDPHRHV